MVIALNIQAMKAAALAGTQGDWELGAMGAVRAGHEVQYTRGSARNQIAMAMGADWMEDGERDANAAHMVASCPSAVLALIERLEKAEAAIVRQGKAAIMGMDAAKAGAAEMERNARDMLGQSNPEALASERAANAMLTEENDRLQSRLDDVEATLKNPRLTGLTVHDNLVSMGLEGGACQAFAEAFAEQFRRGGATNYIEASFDHSDAEIGPLTVTLQRRQGKTPHQLRMEAEAELRRVNGSTPRMRGVGEW